MNKAFKKITLVLVVALLVGLANLRQSSAAFTNGVVLTLQPSKTTVAVNEDFTIDVVMNTRAYQVSAAEIHLTLPSNLQAVSIVPGAFLPVALQAGVVGVGYADITLGSQPTSPAQGTGVVARLTVHGTQNTGAFISFAGSTQAAAIGQTVNVVDTMTGVTVLVGTATPTPTPTYSPTPVPGTVKPSQYGLKEGDMISASGSSDPDIYIVNDWGFKRLFLNPVIFGFYGHLGGYQKVKTVAPSTRDAFGTTLLFRNCESGDSKVYAAQVTGEDSAVLHHVNMSGDIAVAQDANFFKKIFCINNTEYYWYPQSVETYTSVSQIPVYQR